MISAPKAPRRLALVASLLVAGAPAWAQSDPAADRAAEAVVDDLRPLSLVAATAALIHDRTGAYPATPFELLGSPEAFRTGLRGIQFAELTIEAPGQAVYRLAHPAVETQTERTAQTTFAYEADSARHVAEFEIIARRDEDEGGRRIPLTVSDQLVVRVARGRLCIDSDRVAALADAAAFGAAAPYFGDRRALSVSFDGPGDRQVAHATVRSEQ
jgi:hypothetical protein